MKNELESTEGLVTPYRADSQETQPRKFQGNFSPTGMRGHEMLTGGSSCFTLHPSWDRYPKEMTTSPSLPQVAKSWVKSSIKISCEFPGKPGNCERRFNLHSSCSKLIDKNLCFSFYTCLHFRSGVKFISLHSGKS